MTQQEFFDSRTDYERSKVAESFLDFYKRCLNDPEFVKKFEAYKAQKEAGIA